MNYRVMAVSLIPLILALVAVPRTALSQPAGLPSLIVVEEVDIRGGYAQSRMSIRAGSEFMFLKFNVSGLHDLVAVAYAEHNGSIVGRGVLQRDELLITFEEPRRITDVVVVYRDVVSLKERSLIFRTPILLSPFGWNTTATVKVSYPISNIELASKPFNASVVGSEVSFNAMGIGPGTTILLVASASSTSGGILKVDRLERSIVIEEPNYAIVEDNYTLVALSDTKATFITFSYPGYVEPLGVEGVLGPYPRFKDIAGGSAYYRVSRQADRVDVGIRLRAPPQSHGDKNYLVVRLRIPLNSTDGTSEIMAFMDNGFLVDNYAVRIYMRGSAELLNFKVSEEREEEGYKVYAIVPPGPLFEEKLYGSIRARLELHRPPMPSFLTGALIFSLIIATPVLAYVVIRDKRMRKAKRKALERREKEERIPEIYEILRARAQVLDTMLETWRQAESSRISRHTYRQRLSILKREEESLARRAEKLLARASESSEASRIVQTIKENMSDFKKLHRELESVERNFRRGLFSKREYRRKVREIEKVLEERLERIYELVESLKE